MKNDIYRQSIGIFYILLIGIMVLSTAVWKNGFFQMIGKPGKQLKIRTITIVVNVVLSLVLIIRFGLVGAAFATLIVNIFYSLLLNNEINKELKLAIKNV